MISSCALTGIQPRFSKLFRRHDFSRSTTYLHFKLLSGLMLKFRDKIFWRKGRLVFDSRDVENIWKRTLKGFDLQVRRAALPRRRSHVISCRWLRCNEQVGCQYFRLEKYSIEDWVENGILPKFWTFSYWRLFSLASFWISFFFSIMFSSFPTWLYFSSDCTLSI